MGARNKVAGLLGQRFLERKSKMVDEDSHSTDLRVAGEEGHSTILLAHYFFDINWGQSYFQIFTKMLRNLTLLYNLHILTSDQQKFLFFRATFEQLSWQKATFERLFEKLRQTFWKIACNLWKALVLFASISLKLCFQAIFPDRC